MHTYACNFIGKVGVLAYDTTDLAEHAWCMQEAKVAGSGAAAKLPWLSRALKEGTFQLVHDCLGTLVKVHMFFAKHEGLKGLWATLNPKP